LNFVPKARSPNASAGAASIDSCLSFGLIRGGHQLANWMVPGKMKPGMGGAMDLVTGTKRVIVAMVHQAKGKSKILKKCTLPLTSVRRVDLVVTDMAVIEPTEKGLVLRELAPGVTKEQVIAATEATLIIPDELSEMPISCTEETALVAQI
jgi:acetate CoA/acetoacetate CoA-transferase beta subunit